jgi:hypothetical protein
MANKLAANPILVSSTFSTSYKAGGGLPSSGPIFLDEIFWLSPATIGDTFVMASVDGNTVYRTGTCEAALQSQVFPMYGRMISDFSVPTLASGTLYISYH